MPRDSNGNYTLPSGNPVVTGTTIDTGWANPTMADLGNEIQDSLSRTGQGGMLVPFKNFDGTVAAPGVTWNNETISGFYRATSNDMRVSIGGADRFRWTATSVQVWDGTQWVDVGTGDQLVSSVFGRLGDIVAEASDYNALQIDFDNTNTPAWTVTNVQEALDEAYSNIEFLAGAVTLKGTWDADLNEPDLSTIPKINGNYWIVTVAGTTPLPDFPDGLDPIIDHQVNDRVIFIDDGVDSGWEQLRPETGAVSSVFGRIGNVLALEADYAAFYATVAQGALADSALQSGDNVSELVNDAGYITSAQAPVISVFGRSGAVAAQSSDYDANQVDFDNSLTPVWPGLDVQTALENAYDSIEFLAGAVVLKGVWDADTNTPDLLTIPKIAGNYWIVSVEGSTVLPLYPGAPAFILPYEVNDRILWLDDGAANTGFAQLRADASDYLELIGGTMLGDIILSNGLSANTVTDNADNSNVGKEFMPTSSGDLNSIQRVGFYNISGTSLNAPVAVNGTMIVAAFSSGTAVTQLYQTFEQSPRVFVRTNDGSVWGAWKELFTTDGGAINGQVDIFADGEALTIQQTEVDKSCLVGFRNSAGARLGFVGDGSDGNDDIILSSDNASVVLSAVNGDVIVDAATLTNNGLLNLRKDSEALRLRPVTLDDACYMVVMGQDGSVHGYVGKIAGGAASAMEVQAIGRDLELSANNNVNLVAGGNVNITAGSGVVGFNDRILMRSGGTYSQVIQLESDTLMSEIRSAITDMEFINRTLGVHVASINMDVGGQPVAGADLTRKDYVDAQVAAVGETTGTGTFGRWFLNSGTKQLTQISANQFSVPASGNATVTLPTPFADATYSVQVTPLYSGSVPRNNVISVNRTATTFTVYNNESQGVIVSWTCIGFAP